MLLRFTYYALVTLAVAVAIRAVTYVDRPPGVKKLDPIKYANSKSPYPTPSRRQVRKLTDLFKTHTLVQAVLIHRHGTRFPTATDVDSIEKLAEWAKKLQKIPQKQHSWLSQWTSPFDKRHQGQLYVTQGYEDLKHIARRHRRRYAEVLGFPLHHVDEFDVQSTPVDRTEDSAQAYLDQLFGKNRRLQPKLVVLPKDQQWLFYPWSMCPLWKTNVQNSVERKSQNDQIRAKYLQGIVDRLNSDNEFGAGAWSLKDALTAYKACVFGRTLFGIHGEWCTLFTESDLQSFDFVQDQSYYVEHGPGNQINGDMMCGGLQFILNGLKEADAGTSKKRYVWRFNHAETVMHMGVILGIWSVAPTHPGDPNNPYDMSQDLPFAANIHIELWKPKTGGGESGVRILLNERVIEVPNCQNPTPEHLCPLSQFLQIHEKWMNCDPKQVCGVNAQTSSSSTSNGPTSSNVSGQNMGSNVSGQNMGLNMNGQNMGPNMNGNNF